MCVKFNFPQGSKSEKKQLANVDMLKIYQHQIELLGNLKAQKTIDRKITSSLGNKCHVSSGCP